MFAVMKTGGKQYRVKAGDMLRVEKLAGEAGDKISFDQVLMIGSSIGSPLVKGASVVAEVVEQIKADKVTTFVKRRRKHSSQRTRGHRQQLTLVRVTDLLEAGGKPAAAKPAKAPKADAPAKAADAAPAPAAAAKAGTRPANLLEAARGGKPDDLKEIVGVGPVLEKLLHEKGVFHFDQIAAWTADEIDYMDTQIDFPGRIQREEWVKQAKDLANSSKKEA